jgi:hypothetical protein
MYVNAWEKNKQQWNSYSWDTRLIKNVQRYARSKFIKVLLLQRCTYRQVMQVALVHYRNNLHTWPILSDILKSLHILHTYTHVYVRTYLPTYIHAHAYTHMRSHTHTHTHMYTYVCTRTTTQACINALTHTRTHTQIYAHRCTYTHTQATHLAKRIESSSLLTGCSGHSWSKCNSSTNPDQTWFFWCSFSQILSMSKLKKSRHDLELSLDLHVRRRKLTWKKNRRSFFFKGVQRCNVRTYVWTQHFFS